MIRFDATCFRVLLGMIAFLCMIDDVHADRYRVYIGTYTRGDSTSKGVYFSEFDTDTGKLSKPSLAAELDNPSFLAVHPQQRWIYAVNEISEGAGRGRGARPSPPGPDPERRSQTCRGRRS